MKKHLKISKNIVAILLLTIVLFTSNVSLAAWWATPGYEWALSKGLTSVKSKAQLDKTVTHTDFYSTVLKYLTLKGVEPDGKKVYHTDDMTYLNNVVSGLFEIINTYTTEDSLTPEQYRIVENYIEHATTTFNKYKEYLTRENIKNVDLYLALSKYKAATLINDREYKELVLGRIGTIKNSEIFDYGITPYAGDITRKEFLVLMYDLLSYASNINEASAPAVIDKFADAGVLLGYQSDLMLDKPITYSEMLTFMYRFEIFDFNPVVEEEDTEDTQKDVVEIH